MDKKSYDAFTYALVQNFSKDERVRGLVAVGSMAGTHNQPDQWSDHDFLVVTVPGAEEEFRNSTEWLPKHRPIVLHFRETQHGVKVLYDDGHLLEYAFFNAEEFERIVSLNSYRILIDRSDFGDSVQRVVSETGKRVKTSASSDEQLFGQFITHLLVGYKRYQRGERLSGAQFVKNYALSDLIQLIRRKVSTGPSLDSLDFFRRFELDYPVIGKQINQALLLETPQCAAQLLDLAEREPGGWFNNFNKEAVSAVKAVIKHR